VTDLSPIYVVDEIIKLRSKIIIDKQSFDETIVHNNNKGFNYIATVVFNSLLATNLYYKNLSSFGFTKLAFDHLITTIYTSYLRALVNPKEAVGIIAAQSLGEPTTQMALDAFHNLGSGEEGELSTGIPKLKEIIGVSKNPKTPSIKICLKKSSTLPSSSSLESRVEHVKKISNNIEYITVGQLLNKSTIAYKTEENRDEPIFTSYETYGIIIPDNHWTILMEFNRNLLAKKFVSMIELQSAVENCIESSLCSGVEVLIVDDNSKNLTMKLAFVESLTKSTTNPLHLLKCIQQQINSAHVKGIKGIEKCSVKALECDIVKSDGSIIAVSDSGKYEKQEQKDYQFYIQTIGSGYNPLVGSNYSDILNLPDVDPYYTISNNVWDVYEIYGIEAARACLIKEINDVMSSNNISPRHADCLISIMTNQGILISIDRYGVSKGEAGLWVRASFEETVTQITKGSVFGEKDLMTGPSGNIMFGQIVKSGTGGFKVGIDSNRLRSATFKPVPSIFEDNEQEIIINEVNEECALECFEFTYKWD
jgi:DNA-directed RNA polymerase II subunit RPB1